MTRAFLRPPSGNAPSPGVTEKFETRTGPSKGNQLLAVRTKKRAKVKHVRKSAFLVGAAAAQSPACRLVCVDLSMRTLTSEGWHHH